MIHGSRSDAGTCQISDYTMENFDFLVLGSGIAGLSFALEAAKTGSVAVVTKKELAESNTNYAQGGIASVLSSIDSYESHIEDTLTCGAGLSHPDVVSLVVERGPDQIRKLINWGVEFTKGNRPSSPFDLGREGGHSHRRIVHSGDMTGREIERALLERVRNNKNIHLFENHYAVDLLARPTGPIGGVSCFGAYVFSPSSKIIPFVAKYTCLATGGAGKLYLYTSNPDIATGDGIAMAYRAGARIANLEFMQFHPTCLYHPFAKNFLISEAVRGEGGVLRLKSGKTFMEKYHPMGSLAPRDIVARAIDAEMKLSGDDFALLDISHKEADFIKNRFPGIYNKCKEFGIDITTDPISIVPAAHYLCGGVQVDIRGRTNINGLYAIGEVACTGLHGANRLASNSLLEALVFSEAAARDIREKIKTETSLTFKADSWDETDAADSAEAVVVTQNWDEIRRFMWNYVGIVRTDKRLARARRRIDLLNDEISSYYRHFKITPNLIELRNLALLSDLIIRCATARKESRGLHFSVDHPETDDHNWKRDTLIQKTIN